MHELQESKTWRLDANSLNFEAARGAAWLKMQVSPDDPPTLGDEADCSSS